MSDRRRAKQERRARRAHARVERRDAFLDRLFAAARRRTRRGGCVCSPYFALRWPYVLVFHDIWCPLLRAHEGGGEPFVEPLSIADLLDDDGERAA